MPRATMQVGWGDYLLFWAFNIAYGAIAAFLITSRNALWVLPLIIFYTLCYMFAEFIVNEERISNS